MTENQHAGVPQWTKEETDYYRQYMYKGLEIFTFKLI